MNIFHLFLKLCCKNKKPSKLKLVDQYSPTLSSVPRSHSYFRLPAGQSGRATGRGHNVTRQQTDTRSPQSTEPARAAEMRHRALGRGQGQPSTGEWTLHPKTGVGFILHLEQPPFVPTSTVPAARMGPQQPSVCLPERRDIFSREETV